jgi:stage V sporulation protein AC
LTKASEGEKREYQRLQQQSTPSKPLLRNLLLAFAVGGSICAVGQVAMNLFLSSGIPEDVVAGPTAGVMIFLGAFLTGLGVYDKLGKHAGMGSALPITGFANSIVSPAMEFKQEGWVMGVGARMFTVAGPVIVFAVVTSFVVGVLRFVVGGG